MQNSTRVYSWSTSFMKYTDDIPQSVYSDLLFYAGDSCLVVQDKDTRKIGKIISKDFAQLWNWFVEKNIEY